MPNPAKIIFNNGVQTNGVTYTFARDVATVDDSGTVVAINTPRYGRGRAVGSLLKSSDYTTKNTITNVGPIQPGKSSTGYDKNGQTPIAALFGGDSGIRFFRGSLTAPVATRTFVSFQRTIRTGVTDTDLLTGTPDMNPLYYHSYHGPAGLIINTIPGAFIIACNRRLASDSSLTGDVEIIEFKKPSGGEFGDVAGIRKLFTILTHPAGVGYACLNRWSWNTYYPENLPGDSSPPLKIWLVGTDYKEAVAPGAQGGTAWIFSATRATPEDDWTYGPIKTLVVTDVSFTHLHSAGLVFKRTNGIIDRLEVVIFVGDAGLVSHMRRHWCDDVANYSTATWNTQADFYGSNGVYIGDQPASIVQGPDERSLLTASDLSNDAIKRIDVPEDTAAHARISRLWGLPWLAWDGLHVHCPKPEARGPYLAFASSTGNATSTRSLFSNSGRNDWEPHGEVVFEGLIFGSEIARATAASILQSAPLPVKFYRRPLRLGPGGTNFRRGDRPVAGTTGYVPGIGLAGTFPNWTWPSWDGATIPTPPTTCRPVFLEPALPRTYQDVYGDITYNPGVAWPGGRAVARHLYLCHPRQSTNLGTVHLAGASVSGGWLVGSETWFPMVHSSVSSATAEYYFGLNVQAGGINYPWKGLFALDVLYTRDVVPGYSVAGGVTGGNEQLRVFQTCGAQWTAYVLAEVPIDSWLETADVNVCPQAEVPLFTVYANSTNHVFVYVATATGEIKAAVTSNNVLVGTITIANTTAMIVRRDPLRIAVAQTATQVQVTASVSGMVLAEGTLTATLAAVPVEVRFGKPAFVAATPADAANIDLHAVAVYPDAAHSHATRAGKLLSTELLQLSESESTLVLSSNLFTTFTSRTL